MNDNEDGWIVNLHHPHLHPPKILYDLPFLTFSFSRWWRALVQQDFPLLHHCRFPERLLDLLDPVKRNTLRRFCFLWAVAERRSTDARCVERFPSSRGIWWGTCLSTLGRETSVAAMAVEPAIRTAGTWRNTRLNVGTIRWFAERRTFCAFKPLQEKVKECPNLNSINFRS